MIPIKIVDIDRPVIEWTAAGIFFTDALLIDHKLKKWWRAKFKMDFEWQHCKKTSPINELRIITYLHPNKWRITYDLQNEAGCRQIMVYCPEEVDETD